MVNTKTTAESAEERIKQAAVKIFTARGLAGARMQDIADEAGLNKALVHYYFRNKRRLFELVFTEKLFELFSAFSVILQSQGTFEQKIRAFIDKQTELISRYPALPMFVLEEVRKDPAILAKKLPNGGPRYIKSMFEEMIHAEVATGRIRPVAFEQFMINLISLCMYPFVAKPLIQFMLEADDTEFARIVEQRKKLVADLLLKDLSM
ncbi:MAG: TetR family transcriptional regulator [Saprospiraceae bacterium]|nr:TetR family transcriptional regulator [Saprospiraceae bacterium]